MNVLNILAKKRDGKILTKEEIDFFIREYTNGNITDYQAASLLTSIYINGMDDQEITDLTLAMASSGDILDLSTISTNIVDKHSTGGVGDKVSLILLPLVASCGVTVAKMSGRGLGFTGGTIDKLESIPGYEVNISMDEFLKKVRTNGISLISQTLNLAPADKKIYALRDGIDCVGSIPLIASSIMSKKIASGANKIVLDVTVGKGAFMKDMKSAQELAKQMIKIGKLADREVVCILTNMNEPIGYAIGNSIEIEEVVAFLNGDMPEDLKEVVLELGAYMIKLSGLGDDIEENKIKMLENVKNGLALEKLKTLIEGQNGDIRYITGAKTFKKSKYIEEVRAVSAGKITEMDAQKIGEAAMLLRSRKNEKGR